MVAMEWHDSSCRRLDLVSFGGTDTCLSCGSFGEPTTPPKILPPIKHRSEIRILQIQPGEPGDEVHCSVSARNLSIRPDYEAISYTWADESMDATKSKTIFMSTQAFRVTRNCEDALRAVRRSDMPRDVWIDAVCIDQDNVDERGHQVQLMDQIYSMADKVLIYLGEPTHRINIFLETLLYGGSIPAAIKDQWLADFRSGAQELLDRRYFSRIWVLQEITLARKADIVIGRYIVPWNLFRSQLYRFMEYEFLPSTTLPPALVFDYRVYSTPNQLLALLDLARRCDAHDPRDKVYALLGLALDAAQDGFVADYNLNVQQVYSNVATYLSHKHGWAPLLLRAGPPRQSIPGLYPWAPDWSRSSDIDDSDFFEGLQGYLGTEPVNLWISTSTSTDRPHQVYDIYERNTSGRTFNFLESGWLESILNSPNLPSRSTARAPVGQKQQIFSTDLPDLYFVFRKTPDGIFFDLLSRALRISRQLVYTDYEMVLGKTQESKGNEGIVDVHVIYPRGILSLFPVESVAGAFPMSHVEMADFLDGVFEFSPKPPSPWEDIRVSLRRWTVGPIDEHHTSRWMTLSALKRMEQTLEKKDAVWLKSFGENAKESFPDIDEEMLLRVLNKALWTYIVWRHLVHKQTVETDLKDVR